MSLLPNKIHPSWNEFLNKPEIQAELIKIETFLESSLYFPIKENILRFLSVDKDNIQCIIVGMEPYPSAFEINGEQQPIATGRSFEVANVTNWSQKFKQNSLRNIVKTIYLNETGTSIDLQTLRAKIKTKEFEILQPKDWFEQLEKQGVLFLNATLTVEQFQVGTHTKLWENFVSFLILELNTKHPKWLLWGKDAYRRVSPLVEEADIICSSHPRLNDFIAENCFRFVPEIHWTGV